MTVRILIALLSLVLPPAALAQQSISDLDLDTFQRITGGATTATSKNPFSAHSGSGLELAAEDLTLTGIVVGEGEGFALISGIVVQAGQRLAGYEVSAISEDRVILKRLDDVLVLSIEGGP